MVLFLFLFSFSFVRFDDPFLFQASTKKICRKFVQILSCIAASELYCAKCLVNETNHPGASCFIACDSCSKWYGVKCVNMTVKEWRATTFSHTLRSYTRTHTNLAIGPLPSILAYTNAALLRVNPSRFYCEWILLVSFCIHLTFNFFHCSIWSLFALKLSLTQFQRNPIYQCKSIIFVQVTS